MTTYLADGNLLVALTVSDHVHHEIALDWFERSGPVLATCPITQGTLLRFLIRAGQSAADSVALLAALTAQPWHRFWADDLPFDATVLAGVVGQRQVTDAYLVALANQHGGTLATLDRGLAAIHGDGVELLGR